MESLLSLLFPSNSNITGSAMAVPTYLEGEEEDPIDLQIKSLTFVFRRCEIAKSKHFLDPGTDGKLKAAGQSLAHKMSRSNLSDDRERDSFPETLKGISLSDQEKLDIMYNKAEFEKVLVRDEHRILIDWPKNRFRSLCILSGSPADIDRLPTFGSHKTAFSFSILPADSTDEEYVKALSESHMYQEHNVPIDTRRRLVKEALETFPAFEFSDDGFDRIRTKTDRAQIIKTYLTSLAVEVQVQRLYRGSLRIKQPLGSGASTPVSANSRSASPVSRSRSPSPERKAVHAPSSPDRKLYASNSVAVSPSMSPKRVVRSPEPSLQPSSPSRAYIGSRSGSPTARRGLRQMCSTSNLIMAASASNKHPTLHNPTSPKLRKKASTGSLNLLAGDMSSLALKDTPNLSPRQQFRSAPKEGPLEVSEDDISSEKKNELLSQARLAVKSRLVRERGLLARMYDPKLLPVGE